MLRSFLLQRVGPTVVDDLLQDTLLAAWIALPGYHRRAQFKSWLFAISVRKTIDHYRARSRANLLEIVPLDEAENQIGLQKDWFEATDLKQSIEVALERLSSEQREVVEMYYYAGLNLPEIAQTLERKLSSVKYQFYRAHALIENELTLSAQPAVSPVRTAAPDSEHKIVLRQESRQNNEQSNRQNNTQSSRQSSRQSNRKASEIR